MRSARSYFALAVLSTFLLADAGVQAADVPGTLTATLITPETIQVDSIAKASVTFEGVPTSDPEHGDVHVHCEVRAPIIGGPRGFVGPCSYPATAVPLTEFMNAGATVEFRVPSSGPTDFAGVSGIFFQVYVTYADNDGVSSNLVATKAGTKSFSVAKKESGRPADVPGTLTAKLTTPKTIQVGSTAKAQVTFDGVPSSDPVHGDVHVHCEVRAPIGGGRVLCSNPAQAVPLTEFKNAGATVDFKIPKEFAGVSSVFFQVYVTYADNDGVSSNLVAAKAGTESFNVAAKEGPARCRQ